MVMQKRRGGEWLIGAHTRNIPHFSIVTTQDTRHNASGSGSPILFLKVERMTLF